MEVIPERFERSTHALEGILKDNRKENILKGFINRAYTNVGLEKLIGLLGGK